MQKFKTTRRVLAVLLSLVMALSMTVCAFADYDDDLAEIYVDGSGMPAVNMPVTGTQVLDLSDESDGYTVKVYDDGGGAGDCTYNDKDGWLLIRGPVDSVLSLAGSINLKYVGSNVFFEVYDGYDTNYPCWSLSNLEWNVPRDTGLFVSSGNTLLIHFYGAEPYTCEGIELTVAVETYEQASTVTLVDVDNYDHCLIMSDGSACAGETVSVFVFNITGFVLTGLTVRDAYGNNILPRFPRGYEIDNSALFPYGEGKRAKFDPSPLWYGTVTDLEFTMPATDVTIEYAFAPISEGLSIDLPAQGWGLIQIPETVPTFKLYDAGGPDGPMPNAGRTNVAATLAAPYGFHIRLTGSIDVYQREDCSLAVYDGANANCDEILEHTGDADTNDIGVVEGTGNYMFLYFYNVPDDEDFDGLDLTVTLIPDDEPTDMTWEWMGNLEYASLMVSVGGKDYLFFDYYPETVFTTQPTCTEDGTGYYVASVEFAGRTYTDQSRETTIPGSATGHTCGEPVWSFTQGEGSVKAAATFTCEKCDHSFTLYDEAPVKTTVTGAGCLTDATVRYTGSVEYGGETFTATSEEMTDAGTALGHDFAEEWSWFGRTNASLKLTCARCRTVEQHPLYSEEITESIITPATADTDGEVLCSATVTDSEGRDHTGSHTFTILKTGGHLVLGDNAVNPQAAGWQNAVVCDFTPAENGEYTFTSNGAGIPCAIVDGEYIDDNAPDHQFTFSRNLFAGQTFTFKVYADYVNVDAPIGISVEKTGELTDEAVADVVSDLIDAIGEVEYTEDCAARIEAARAAYDALTEGQQALVTNYGALTAAEDRYAELKDAAEHPDPDEPDENLCKWCGEAHEGVWGKIVGFFHSILYFFAHLFGKR